MELDQARRYPQPASGPALSGLLRALERIEAGSLVVGYRGSEWLLEGRSEGPCATLCIHRPLGLLGRVTIAGAVGLAESYTAGDWDSPDLTETLVLLALNEPALAAEDRALKLVNWFDRLRHRSNRNSLRGSRRNIAAHYDLGNDFYRLWLDPSMTYSCGLYDGEGQGLESAQERKYQRLLDLLDARSGDRVLEVGCGWGGFALAAARRGLRVTGITLSREQLRHARSRVGEAGLAHRVELRLQDYRELDETFDHVVSIEMLEAVGEEHWDSYMQRLQRCLRPGGRAALQFITIDESVFEQYRVTPDFIQRYIFPGGMLPTRERFADTAVRAGFRLEREDLFGEDYARTLREWHHRFQQSESEVAGLGFDERFRRMWRYYLSYCEAGFRVGRIDLAQVLLSTEADQRSGT
jgi:cyclopropane-fatty-acyl-phospholipid synthase